MPELSVITINFNNRDGLKRTIESVVSQSFSGFEFIVIDGESTDGSIDVIRKYEPRINYWVSEKDAGIYDALNKGLKAATGEYVIFLNSGDTFFSKLVTETFVKFAENKKQKLIYGNSIVWTDNNKSEVLSSPAHLDLNFWYRKTLNHQAVFSKRELFSTYGVFDLKYKICADFDFILKVFLAEPAEFIHFDHIVCNYDESGFSASPENYDKMLEERNTILKSHLSPRQFKAMKETYNSSLPLKQRILNSIYERPLLNAAFKRVYNVYSRLKGTDGQ